MQLTPPIRFRTAVTLALALATFGCANAGTDLTGPGGRRAALDVADDSSAVTAEWASGEATSDGSTVASDSAAAADEEIVVAAPEEGGYDPQSGYIVAY